MEKRSLTLSGHRTSVALEPDFWRALETIAASRGLSLAALVQEIDARRRGTGLASSIRLAVLDWYADRARTDSATTTVRN